MPTTLETLFLTIKIWSCQVKCSSRITPKNLTWPDNVVLNDNVGYSAYLPLRDLIDGFSLGLSDLVINKCMLRLMSGKLPMLNPIHDE